jgi:cell division septum initiation protein DivIVA
MVSEAVTVALITAIPLMLTAISGVLVIVRRQDRVEQKVDVNTSITTQTRDMADGRLTAVTAKVDELTAKLAASEANVARLVNDGVAHASTEVLTKAATASTEMIAKAQATAAALLDQAKVAATALLAQAERDSSRRR